MKEEYEKIIYENKNLIYKIAHKYSSYYNMEDLFQVGVIGLIKAYNNYNPNCNTKLSTYAYEYILGEILEYIRTDRTVKVSTDLLKLYKSYEKTKEYLTNKLGRVPKLSEISNFMNIEENKLSYIIEKCAYVVSLDEDLNEDNFTLEQVVGVDNQKQIDNLLDIKKELASLNEEERKLIELRYFKDLTQSETAEVLGINQVQVSRSEKLILKKMNSKLAS